MMTRRAGVWGSLGQGTPHPSSGQSVEEAAAVWTDRPQQGGPRSILKASISDKASIDAAREGDTERFATDYDEGVATQEGLLDAATDAGVPECAKVDR